MTKLLTLRGPGKAGEVVWHDDQGTFSGTDAVELGLCAKTPQAHPAWPITNDLPGTNARALIVLLACLNWDVPAELADEAAEWLKGQPEVPRDAVA